MVLLLHQSPLVSFPPDDKTGRDDSWCTSTHTHMYTQMCTCTFLGHHMYTILKFVAALINLEALMSVMELAGSS